AERHEFLGQFFLVQMERCNPAANSETIDDEFSIFLQVPKESVSKGIRSTAGPAELRDAPTRDNVQQRHEVEREGVVVVFDFLWPDNSGTTIGINLAPHKRLFAFDDLQRLEGITEDQIALAMGVNRRVDVLP